MKTENTMSTIALAVASLSMIDVLNIGIAVLIGITAIALNIRKYQAERARERKEVAEKKLLDHQLSELKNEK
ncbi:hypothetical protein ACFSTE_15740 [Aquimarina hainanensis]|uniref:Holin n=1 Tax=Aquimarina hainanensis TaxID=1578017 RepID=A0ABW5ND00_9FLAO